MRVTTPPAPSLLQRCSLSLRDQALRHLEEGTSSPTDDLDHGSITQSHLNRGLVQQPLPEPAKHPRMFLSGICAGCVPLVCDVKTAAQVRAGCLCCTGFRGRQPSRAKFPSLPALSGGTLGSHGGRNIPKVAPRGHTQVRLSHAYRGDTSSLPPRTTSSGPIPVFERRGRVLRPRQVLSCGKMWETACCFEEGPTRSKG